MDKYEFNIKVEQIKKMVSRSDYETAMKIADTIDWRRVRNVNILSMVATIYEKNEEYQEAKDILLLAFERAPIGKRLLYKLAELAIKEGSFQEAEDYYREFCDLAQDDPRQYILRYLILGAKGAPTEQLIHTLEQYCNIELDEKWLYELAELYAQADMGDLCVMACDKIMLMFGLGKYVEKAMELKIQFAPLTKYQMDLVENRDKYEAKLKAVEQEFGTGIRRPGYGGISGEAEEKTAPAPAYRARTEAAYTREPEAEYPEAGYGNGRYAEEGDPDRGYAGDGYAEEGDPDRGYAGDGYAEEGDPDQGYAGDGYAEDGYPESAYSEGGYAEDGYARDRYSRDGYEGYPGDEYPKEEQPESGYPPEGGPEDGYDGEYEESYGEGPEQYEEPHAQVTIEPEDPDTAGEMPKEDGQPEWMQPEPAHMMSEETLKARMHEAEIQADLAMEMSRISGGAHRPEVEAAQTRVLTDIRDLTKDASAREARHLMIEAEDAGAGLEQAVALLKKIHKETGAKNQAAKITGEKLNSKGLFSIADKLTGKDLIIEHAGIMEDSILQELNQLMARDETGMNVVLIDSAGSLERIHKVYPGLFKRFEYVGNSAPDEKAYTAPQGDVRPVRQVQVRPTAEEQPRKALRQPEDQPAKVLRQPEEQPVKKVRKVQEQPIPSKAEPVKAPQPKKEVRPVSQVRAQIEPPQPEPEEVDDTELDIDEFAKYACQYAGDIDCSISGKSMLALYERIEIMEEDGIPLTKVNAEDLIEEAADKAENPSFFKRLTGIFSSKYDKEGLLILKEEHFI